MDWDGNISIGCKFLVLPRNTMMLMNRVCNSCVGDVHKFEIGLDLWILHLGVIVLQEIERVIKWCRFYMSCATE